MTITAKRRTGKSILTKDICSKIKTWYAQVYLFSTTADLQPDLYDFIEPKNRFNGFDEAKLEQLWNQQEKIVMSLKRNKSKELPHILLIFDDITSDPRVKKSPILNKLFVAGRHLCFAQIILSQTFTGLPPTIRTNVDVAIAFYLDSQVDREAFSKQYLSTKNVRLGIMIFERITREPYQAIVCLNFKTSQNPEDVIRTYVANPKVYKFMMKSNLRNMPYVLDSIDRPVSVGNNDLKLVSVNDKKKTIKYNL